MTVVQRLVRRNLFLGGVAVLFLLVLVFRAAPTSALRTSEMPALFPDLEAATARTIELERAPTGDTEGGQPLRLTRVGDAAWQVESRGGYPASDERVRAFLEALEGAREKKVVTQREDTFADYAGPDGWTQVRVLDGTGKALAAFALGKAAGWPDSYVRMSRDGVERVIRAHNLTGDKLGLDVDHWVEARVWPQLSLPQVTGIDVSQRPTKRTLSFKRSDAKQGEGEEADTAAGWQMVAPKTAEAVTMQVEGLIRAFTGMRLGDVPGPVVGDEAEATYGFDRPTYRVVVYAREKDDAPESKYVLEIGKPSKGDLENAEAWYVRRAGDTWALEVPTYAISEFERAPEDFLPPPEEPEPMDEPEPTDLPAPTDASGDPDGAPAPGSDTTGDPDGAPPVDAPSGDAPTDD